MERLKVLIADDTLVSRRVFSEAVENTGLGTVVHTASNVEIAFEWLKQCDIDVVLLDVIMPQMDGIETLKAIKKEFPDVQVIMISAGETNSAQATIEALKLGAMDFILKPRESNLDKNIERIRNQLNVLFAQIKVGKLSSQSIKKGFVEKIEDKSVPIIPDKSEMRDKVKTWNGADIVVIASSTGGPAALEKIFRAVPSDFKKPILVVQHMPPDFTRILAQVLNSKSHLNVIEGSEGLKIKEEQVIIAPGGLHMIVEVSAGACHLASLHSPAMHSGLDNMIRVIDTPYVNGVRPAADVLFQSIAKVYSGKNILAVVLTGMGSDGMQGIAELKKKCNCFCITQSENTCVVYGMPRSVYEAELSDEVVDLENVSSRMHQLAYGRG